MTTCEQIDARLTAYAEGSLTPGERRDVDDHLRECPTCRALVRDLKSTLDLLGSALAGTAAGLPSVLTSGARDDVVSSVMSAGPERGCEAWLFRRHPALAIAASLMLVAGVAWLVVTNVRPVPRAAPQVAKALSRSNLEKKDASGARRQPALEATADRDALNAAAPAAAPEDASLSARKKRKVVESEARAEGEARRMTVAEPATAREAVAAHAMPVDGRPKPLPEPEPAPPPPDEVEEVSAPGAAAPVPAREVEAKRSGAFMREETEQAVDRALPPQPPRADTAGRRAKRQVEDVAAAGNAAEDALPPPAATLSPAPPTGPAAPPAPAGNVVGLDAAADPSGEKAPRRPRSRAGVDGMSSLAPATTLAARADRRSAGADRVTAETAATKQAVAGAIAIEDVINQTLPAHRMSPTEGFGMRADCAPSSFERGRFLLGVFLHAGVEARRDVALRIALDERIVLRPRIYGYAGRHAQEGNTTRVNVGDLPAGTQACVLMAVRAPRLAGEGGTLVAMSVSFKADGEMVRRQDALPAAAVRSRFGDAAPALRVAAIAGELADLLNAPGKGRSGRLAAIDDALTDLESDGVTRDGVAVLRARVDEARRAWRTR